MGKKKRQHTRLGISLNEKELVSFDKLFTFGDSLKDKSHNHLLYQAVDPLNQLEGDLFEWTKRILWSLALGAGLYRETRGHHLDFAQKGIPYTT